MSSACDFCGFKSSACDFVVLSLLRVVLNFLRVTGFLRVVLATTYFAIQ